MSGASGIRAFGPDSIFARRAEWEAQARAQGRDLIWAGSLLGAISVMALMIQFFGHWMWGWDDMNPMSLGFILSAVVVQWLGQRKIAKWKAANPFRFGA